MAYYSLHPVAAADYENLQSEILVCCDLSPTNSAAVFHKWAYNTRASPQAQMDTLLHTTQRWLQPDQHTASQVINKVMMDEFLPALPPEEHKSIYMRGAASLGEMLEALECTIATLEIGQREGREAPLGRCLMQPSQQMDVEFQGERRRPNSHPDYGTARDEPMPTKLDPQMTQQP